MDFLVTQAAVAIGHEWTDLPGNGNSNGKFITKMNEHKWWAHWHAAPGQLGQDDRHAHLRDASMGSSSQDCNFAI